MMPAAESINPLTEAIQLAIAPVFLLTGVAGMLNALGIRLARVIDRGRALEDILIQSSPSTEPRFDQFMIELQSLDQRRKIINGATALMVLCAVLIGLTVVELFYSTGLQGRLQLSHWVATTFLLGFGSFIAACVLYLVEIILASRSITLFKKRP
ncbi:MAG: DUF2721 domain-containing protein [Betaproteobacteria bacterium]|jgi:hypothetical protein|nr:DUF2721 domain-containing protein [Betaproteobacteria bacterium]